MVNHFDPRSFLLLRASSVFCDLIVSIVLAAKIHLDNRRRELNRATIKCRMLTNTLFKEVQATLPITFYRLIFEEEKRFKVSQVLSDSLVICTINTS